MTLAKTHREASSPEGIRRALAIRPRSLTTSTFARGSLATTSLRTDRVHGTSAGSSSLRSSAPAGSRTTNDAPRPVPAVCAVIDPP